MKNKSILIVAMVIVALFGDGCKQNAVTEKSDPKETYLNALKKLKEVKFYTAKQNFSATSSISYAFIAPDKKKTDVVLNGKTVGIIYIGSDKYSGSDANGYTKSAVESSDKKENWQFPTKEIFYDPDKIEKVKFVKKDTIEGREGFSYQDENSGTLLFISAETGLPLRVAALGSTDDSIIVTDYFYDKEPKIEVPTNVK